MDHAAHTTPDVPPLSLVDGGPIPQLGLGVFTIPDDETERVVRTALDVGYRSVDTAAMYRNESGVGRGIAESGLSRDDVFVTTKLNNREHGYDAGLRALDASLGRLGLDYVDLYLIHWPLPAQDLYVETWRALERALADGKARAIGVSNFQISHLRRLLDECERTPSVNQIELHPEFPQAQLRAFHDEHGIRTEAWAPLAKGGELLGEQTITSLADKYGKTPAQIVLRWHVQLDNIVIPKSVTPSRIEENIQVFDFELAPDDMASIDALETGRRIGPNPDHMN